MTTINRLKELMSAATPGPWTVRMLDNFGFNVVHYVDGDKFNIRRVAKVGDEHDAALIAELPTLLATIARLERERDIGCCDGCGSTESIEQIRATHPTAFTCCPERKMLSAEEWRARALAAEKERDEAIAARNSHYAMFEEQEALRDAAENALTTATARITEMEGALEKIKIRTAKHPDDTPEDAVRDKYMAHSTAINALGRAS